MAAKAYETERFSIYIDFSDLGDGETQAGAICPACNGGATQEGSLSVTRRGNSLLFLCHRNACDFRGSIGVDGSAGGGAPRAKSSNRGLHIQTYPLNEATVKLLATKFRVSAETVRLAGARWTGDIASRYGRRISYPIFGPDAKERGKNLRSYEGSSPKSIVILDDEATNSASWYKWRRASKFLVVVEDQPSAFKVAPHHDALALCGTGMSDAKIDEIKAGGYERVYLSLDNDATADAIRIQLDTRSTLPHMVVLALHRDIKDMDDAEFKEYLARIS